MLIHKGFAYIVAGLSITLACAELQAQPWLATPSNDGIFYNGGKVGIGTTSPTGQLQVSGSFTAPSPGDASLLRINTVSNPVSFGDIYALKFDPVFVRAASGTHSYFMGVNIQAPILTGGGAAVTNAVSLFVAGQPSGASNNYAFWVASGTSRIDGNVFLAGNMAVGTNSPNPAYKVDINGAGHVSGDFVVDGNLAAKYQDVAEWVPASAPVDTGTVVVLDVDKNNTVKASFRPYDTTIAGVVSDKPGVLLGVGGDEKAKIATTGRVQVKVDARTHPIRVGDLLVTSSESGSAMRSLPIIVNGLEMHRPGTLIGKALEPLQGGTGKILVLLSLQ